jgi:hypothetical protein
LAAASSIYAPRGGFERVLPISQTLRLLRPSGGVM